MRNLDHGNQDPGDHYQGRVYKPGELRGEAQRQGGAHGRFAARWAPAEETPARREERSAPVHRLPRGSFRDGARLVFGAAAAIALGIGAYALGPGSESGSNTASQPPAAVRELGAEACRFILPNTADGRPITIAQASSEVHTDLAPDVVGQQTEGDSNSGDVRRELDLNIAGCIAVQGSVLAGDVRPDANTPAPEVSSHAG